MGASWWLPTNKNLMMVSCRPLIDRSLVMAFQFSFIDLDQKLYYLELSNGIFYNEVDFSFEKPKKIPAMI